MQRNSLSKQLKDITNRVDEGAQETVEETTERMGQELVSK
jgi:DNA anti-recombination protein RmuC